MIRKNHSSARTAPQTRARRGVTLVEMLVATAMCIMGMWMLTWMFQQATASFSLANAQATLTTQERMVTTIMTRDLDADKFPEDDRNFVQTGNRRRRLSDQQAGFGPPRGGYFFASAPTVIRNSAFDEQADTYGFPSSRSSHILQFTVMVPDTPGGRLVAEVPAGSGKSVAGTAIEVSYFLVPTGTTATGAQLYDLMRVQRLTAISPYDARDYLNTIVQPAYNLTPSDTVHEVMTSAPGVTPAPATMFTLEDLSTNVSNCRFGRTVRGTNSKRYGEDRLLSNVLSMEVKFTGPAVGSVPGTGGWNSTPVAWPTEPGSPNMWPRPFDPIGAYSGNKDYPYDFLPFDGQYDTATNGTPSPVRQSIRITGAQIKVRALFGTTARQTTFTVTP